MIQIQQLNIQNGCLTKFQGQGEFAVPEGVTEIGKKAFLDCAGLKSLALPASLGTIESRPFQGCAGLTSVTVSPQNTAYSCIDGVLFDKKGTTLIYYPRGKGNDYTVPEGVTKIGGLAFRNCAGLTSLTLPASLIEIGGATFANRDDFAEGATFEGCPSLKSLTLPNSLTRIRLFTFRWCTGLTSLTFPDSLTEIGEAAFSYCTGLTSIVASGRNTAYSCIDGVLFDKEGTTLICYPAGKGNADYTPPASLTKIGGYAFSGCKGLTSLTLPDSLTEIGDHAFHCAGLTSVSIPKHTNVDSDAFRNCPAKVEWR
jgi:predicted lipoprotein with Yx(FWY)xxD motif